MVKTMDQALASQQMTLLEEGASVIEWIAIVRPSSKNRALAAGTRSLVATARTRYLGFGKIKMETPALARAGQPQHSQSPSQPQPQPQLQPQRSQGRTASFSEMLQSQYPSVTPSNDNTDNRTSNGQRLSFNNGAWGNDFARFHAQAQQHQPAPLSSSSQTSSNAFDWSAYQFLQNMSSQQTPLQHQQQQPHNPQQHQHHHQQQQQQQQQQPPASAMQTLPVGQISPMDLTIPMPMQSPTQSIHQGMSNTSTNPITFGHLPMMPNQMDNWPMSMQNLGGLGTMTPAPDPYAPSSEGFDMWLSSILSDSNGTGQGQGGQ